MTSTAPPVGRIILVRHGSTEWSRSGQHTGRTDIPLDEEGRAAAVELAARLATLDIVTAISSPLSRALDTCRLAGFAEPALSDDLLEWDYGEYEGRTTAEIHKERPGWSIFKDGCPGGESLADVEGRCEAVIDRLSLDPEAPGSVALFAHGHLLRVLGATYLGIGGAVGALLTLDTASVSTLGFERRTRVVRNWNT